MDGSRTTPASGSGLPRLGQRAACRSERLCCLCCHCYKARRREQLRLWLDPATRAAAARVMALQDTDADAFSALYLRYAPYVAAMGMRLLARDDELDELLQDVFMQLLRSLHRLHDASALKGCLAQLTIRSATRRLRGRTSRSALTQPLSCTHTLTPEQRMLSREVYNQLDGLHPQVRAVWVLRHVAGEPLHRIAQRSGCPVSTVRRRLNDAQSTLVERFTREYAI